MLCRSDSIRDDDPVWQRLCNTAVETQTLTELLMAVWPLARLLTLPLVAAVLAERAHRPTSWPRCPGGGAWLKSQGFVDRQITSLLGVLRWQRRVGRCPAGCAIGQVAPVDKALGLQPHQRTSGELQIVGCALAVFMPCATAAQLLGWYSGGLVSPRALWCWGQAAGCRAMDMLRLQLEAVAQGALPGEEPVEATLRSVPVIIGADGVMVPFRPQGGQPTGKTSWRDIKVGVLARLSQHRPRTGQGVSRLHQRRVGAVLGIGSCSSHGWGSQPCVRAS